MIAPAPLHLVLPMEPVTVTAQGKRIASSGPSFVVPGRSRRILRGGQGRVKFFHTAAYKDAEKALAQHLMVALAGPRLVEFRQFRGPVQVYIGLFFPYRARERADVRQEGREIPHDTRPDLDNLSKLYLDALMAAGVLADDGQVYELRLRKMRSPNPRIEYAVIPAALLK